MNLSPIEPVYCVTCDNVEETSRKGSEYRWLCMKHKRLDGKGYTSPNSRIEEPYLYCKDVNGGMCPLWTARREADNV